MQTAALDRTDLALLRALQAEGRLSNVELAERVNLSPSACLRRVQRLEAEGVITGYRAEVDPAKLGLHLRAFVRVQLKSHGAADIARFAESIQSWDEVERCLALTGEARDQRIDLGGRVRMRAFRDARDRVNIFARFAEHRFHGGRNRGGNRGKSDRRHGERCRAKGQIFQ